MHLGFQFGEAEDEAVVLEREPRGAVGERDVPGDVVVLRAVQADHGSLCFERLRGHHVALRRRRAVALEFDRVVLVRAALDVQLDGGRAFMRQLARLGGGAESALGPVERRRGREHRVRLEQGAVGAAVEVERLVAREARRVGLVDVHELSQREEVRVAFDDAGHVALGHVEFQFEHRGFALGRPAFLLGLGDGLDLAHLVWDVEVLGVHVAEVLVHRATERPLGLAHL